MKKPTKKVLLDFTYSESELRNLLDILSREALYEPDTLCARLCTKIREVLASHFT